MKLLRILSGYNLEMILNSMFDCNRKGPVSRAFSIAECSEA